jgi:hypothetical protein
MTWRETEISELNDNDDSSHYVLNINSLVTVQVINANSHSAKWCLIQAPTNTSNIQVIFLSDSNYALQTKSSDYKIASPEDNSSESERVVTVNEIVQQVWHMSRVTP